VLGLGTIVCCMLLQFRYVQLLRKFRILDSKLIPIPVPMTMLSESTPTSEGMLLSTQSRET